MFYIIAKQTTTHKAFVFFPKYSNITRKPAFAHFGEDKKKPFDLYKMKQFHWLLCVAKNCDWSRKITPLSNVTRASQTYSESRIELRNLQILKKMLEKLSQFLSSEQPREPKSFDVALKIAGFEKVPSKSLWLRST